MMSRRNSIVKKTADRDFDKSSNPVLERFYELVNRHPEKVALVDVPDEGAHREVSWGKFDRASNQVARMLAELGVEAGDVVVIAVRNSEKHYFLTYAAWKLGALALPLRAETPPRERDAILELAKPAAIYAEWDDVGYPLLKPDRLDDRDAYASSRLPNVHPHPGKAIASGGSTGRPKIVLDPTWSPLSWGDRLGVQPEQVQLMAAPLYHNSPLLVGNAGLMQDHTIVIMRRFDAARAVDLIEQYEVNYAYTPPIIMQRIARLPDIEQRDLSSMQGIHSSAAVCPGWVKRTWIDLIGAEHVWEVYGSSEGVGATIIRSDEWLEHPGSVGRPSGCEIKIVGDDGEALPPGEVGEIYSRRERGVTSHYLGAPPISTTADGFASVGDLGWLDPDGYLYIADRRTDMIVSGGVNIYPAEVEAAIGEHPEVADCVVVGVPDDEWGRRVHAIIQPSNPASPPAAEQLDLHVRERLTNYKAPKTYEFVAVLPRNEAGKIRRSQLAAERETGAITGAIPARGQ